jgi:hypothetical protein
MILIWTPRCLNTWQMPPFIGQNLELLICWLIDEWVATSWLCDNSYLLVCQKIIDNVIIWTDFNHESSRKLSHLFKVKFEIIWISRTRDMSWILNSLWATGQIRTSSLLLQFGLENDLVKSWAPHESCRPMSYLSIYIK